MVLARLPLLGLVAMMMDYMLPKKVMSWQEAWEIYFTEAGGSLFQDLARYGLKSAEIRRRGDGEARAHLASELGDLLPVHAMPPAFHTWMPDSEHLDWLSEKYPNTFDKYYRPRWEMWAQKEKEGKRFYNMALPQLCQTCQIPMAFTEPGDPTTICFRETQFKGNTLSLLLGRLQRHLRRRAREIRPVLAAGASDLPGQLRRPDRAGRARLVQAERRRGQHGLRRLSRRETVERWHAERRPPNGRLRST